MHVFVHQQTVFLEFDTYTYLYTSWNCSLFLNPKNLENTISKIFHDIFFFLFFSVRKELIFGWIESSLFHYSFHVYEIRDITMNYIIQNWYARRLRNRYNRMNYVIRSHREFNYALNNRNEKIRFHFFNSKKKNFYYYFIIKTVKAIVKFRFYGFYHRRQFSFVKNLLKIVNKYKRISLLHFILSCHPPLFLCSTIECKNNRFDRTMFCRLWFNRAIRYSLLYRISYERVDHLFSKTRYYEK